MPRIAQPFDDRHHYYCRCAKCAYTWISPCPDVAHLPKVCPLCRRKTWKFAKGQPVTFCAQLIVNPFR